MKLAILIIVYYVVGLAIVGLALRVAHSDGKTYCPEEDCVKGALFAIIWPIALLLYTAAMVVAFFSGDLADMGGKGK